ncbi:hypothetical protein [Amycolatopsis sp. GM8]|uniref:FitA-like ribbon-helix-helix domain-containing protein n=1 Tax=Amycolatopsis sp. GM8 TaxID=2896530 RepID=UPI001F2E9DE7|nr:hypothetical protein [Amycolatopsis sp. GM8]
MATIQIRNVPDETYEALREAAKAEGKSLQAYMEEQMGVLARLAEKRLVFDALQRVWERTPRTGLTKDEIVAEIRSVRGE